jgi:hypothetical protein
MTGMTAVPHLRETGLQAQPFVYASARLGLEDLRLMTQTVGGLLVRGRSGAAKLTQLRRAGFSLPVAIDPAVYELDEDSVPESPSLFGEQDAWLALQQEHRVAFYLSPSRYVPAGDERRLHEVLEAGKRFCASARGLKHAAGAFIVLPADRSWVSEDSGRLVRALQAAAEPVALMLADPNDPLSSRAAVYGLAHVLRQVPMIALLRTDLAAIGALAHGAALTAIGATTTVRHIPSPDRPGGGARGNDGTPRVLVEPLLSYRKGSWLAQLEDDQGMLDCWCSVCKNPESQSLRRFDDPELTSEAHLHSVRTWSAIAARVLAADPSRRPTEWSRMCIAAIEAHEELADRTGIPIRPLAYLRAWAELA